MDRNVYEQILTDAIAGEVEAHEFYKGVSNRVKDPYLKEMFLRFSQEEWKHKEILENFKSQQSGNLHFRQAPDYRVAETVETPALSADMKPSDAIAIAMKKEEQAMKHYTSLANACTDDEKKNVFMELASMEREHKNKMEQAFVDIGYPEVW